MNLFTDLLDRNPSVSSELQEVVGLYVENNDSNGKSTERYIEITTSSKQEENFTGIYKETTF